MQKLSGKAVGVPGQLRGLELVHREYGRWADHLSPLLEE